MPVAEPAVTRGGTKFVRPNAGGGGGDNVGWELASARDMGTWVFSPDLLAGFSPVRDGHITSDANEQPLTIAPAVKRTKQDLAVFLRASVRAMF